MDDAEHDVLAGGFRHPAPALVAGDVDRRRERPVQARGGGLDGGRAREHVYQVAPEPEIVEVGELSYNALRVSRVDEGRDDMIVWIADGVPTPVRILQLDDDGEDDVDLRLIEYQGVQ